MAMKAHVRTDSSGNVTVYMRGDLDYENNSLIKGQLLELLDENPAGTITLDLNNMDFIGSSGIGIFVETIKILNEKRNAIKLANVHSDFLKVFQLYDKSALEYLIERFDTDETDNLSQLFANRKKTFEN
jgi:anti-sigma B factor antagonist